MRKLAILGICFLLLSVTACGSFTNGADDAEIIDAKNTESNAEETDAHLSYIAFADVDIRELDTYILENQKELEDTTWFLAGGKTTDAEWTEAEYMEKMTAYQGNMGFVFQADGTLSFLQGDVTYQGEYYFDQDGVLMISYDAAEGRMVYSCKFADGENGECIMIASGDDSMDNVLYMISSDF